MTEFLQRLKQRKLVRWAIAYVAGAWVALQVLDLISGEFGWPRLVMLVITVVLAIGFFVALVLAWYHGERGAQRVGGIELVMLAALLVIAAVAVTWVRHEYGHAAPRMASTQAPVRATQAAATATRAPPAATAASTTLPAASAIASQPIPAKSVAVLPFENLSGDPHEKYFSDGITVEILNALAQIPDLKVSGRTSAFQFSSKDQNLREIGAKLGVVDVLTGSVQKAGDEVRITVQLVDTRTGYQMWSEKYDRKLTNVFTIEDEISDAVANKLRVQLTGGAGQALVAQESIDPRAHDFYLRGLALLAARGPGLRNAVAAFQSALKIDSKYADAWGALAEAQALYPDYHLEPMSSAYASALADAKRALSLNPDLASAYVAQGIMYKNQWRWADADAAFRRALALAPNDAEALNQYAQFLVTIGQFEPALAAFDRAQQLDPLSGVIGAARAGVLADMRRYQQAALQIASVVAAHPDFALGHEFAISISMERHQYAEAEKQARLLASLAGRNPDGSVSVVKAAANPALRAGVLRKLETSAGFAGGRRDSVTYARILAVLGAYDQALAVLQRIANQRNSSNMTGLWSAAFDPIRNDPRFKAVLKKMGLPYTPPVTVLPPK